MKFLIGVVVFVQIFDASFACHGFKVKTNYLRNCAGVDSLVKLEPTSSVKLDKECKLAAKGCVEVGAFKTAEITFEILRSGLRMARGVENICEKMEKIKEEEKAVLTILGIPDHCPFEKTKLCPDAAKAPNLDKIGKFLPMAIGTPITVLANITHDTGISCLEAEIAISKK